jgi:hypothetical protein
MSEEVLPWIEKHNYATFHAMIGDLPPTYNEWKNAHAMAMSQRPEALEVEISPADVHAYLRRGGQRSANSRLLHDCAAEKAGVLVQAD